MFLLSRRQGRAALTGAAASAIYLAAAQIGAQKLKLSGLFVLASASMAAIMASGASSKARVTEARLNNMLNNGFSVGGDVTVQGVHRAAGGLTISGTALTLNHGGITAPGGAPGSYSAAYETSLDTAIANIDSKLRAANIF